MDLNTIIRSEQADTIILQVKASDLRDLIDTAMEFAASKIKQSREPEYYTREELLAKLDVSAPTLLSYRNKGLIPKPVTLGGRVLYDKKEVAEALAMGKLRKFKIRNPKHTRQ